MPNKKIILSILIIGAVVTVAGAETWAYYQDTISITGTTIQTGTLYLTSDPDTSLLTIADVSPGSSGTLYQTITNSGTLPGKLKIDFGNIQESVVKEVPSSTGTDTLLDSVKVNIKLVKADDSTLVEQLAGSDSYPVSIESCNGLSASNIAMEANTSYTLVVYYEIPAGTDTGIQGKKLTFGITYTLSS